VKPASGPQLWRLNSAGLLEIRDEPGEPIDMPAAWGRVSQIAAKNEDAFDVVVLDPPEAA
jgi:hypothetical protein